jgi:hypothetical protein
LAGKKKALESLEDLTEIPKYPGEKDTDTETAAMLGDFAEEDARNLT